VSAQVIERYRFGNGGAEFGAQEFDGPKINSWKMQDLKNDGHRARCRPMPNSLSTWHSINTTGRSTADVYPCVAKCDN